jgi:hypothetical protein
LSFGFFNYCVQRNVPLRRWETEVARKEGLSAKRWTVLSPPVSSSLAPALASLRGASLCISLSCANNNPSFDDKNKEKEETARRLLLLDSSYVQS